MSKDRDGVEDNARRAPDLADGGVAADGAVADPEPDVVADFGPEQDDLVVVGDSEGVDERVELPDEVRDQLTDAELAEQDEFAENEPVPAGATAAGSNRARVGSRSGSTRVPATTAKKAAPTRTRDTTDQLGVLARLQRFVREVVAELRKVIWPSRKQWATFTLVVIVFLVVMTALVAGLDVLFHLVVGKVFG